jgi:hypothetical protein
MIYFLSNHIGQKMTFLWTYRVMFYFLHGGAKMIVIFYGQGEWHWFNQEVFYLRSIFEIRILFASTNTRVFVHL